MTTNSLPIDMAPILSLSVMQRRAVIDAIEDSIPVPPHEISDEFYAELMRRYEHSQAHPEECFTLEQIRAELAVRYPDDPESTP